MRTKVLILLAFLFSGLLSACVKDQSNTTTDNMLVTNPQTQNIQNQSINDINYQQTLRNQTARAQAFSASHGGGGRR